VLRRHDDHKLVAAHDPAAQPARQARALDEAQIRLAVEHRRDRVVTVDGSEDNLWRGDAVSFPGCLERDEPTRHQLFGDCQARNHFYPVSAFRAQRGKAGVDVLCHAEQLVSPLGDNHAGLGELGAPCRAGHELHPSLSFDRGKS
jgi:hypothetical protein